VYFLMSDIESLIKSSLHPTAPPTS
jgi:hypothetical protein